MATETIDIRIREDGARVVSREIEKIGESAKETDDMMNMLKRTLGTIAAALSIQKLVQYADAWASISGKIRIATASHEEAVAVQNELFQVAQTAGQGIGDITDLYSRAARAGAELGASQEQLVKFTENVAKTLTASSTSATQAQGALFQLGQALGSGTVRAEEYNAILEGAPAILTVVAKNIEGANGSVSQLGKMMRNGELSSKAFFDAFLKGTDQIDKDFGKAARTIGQGLTRVDNAFMRFIGTTDEALGVSDKLVGVLNFVAENFDEIASAALAVGAAIAVAFAPSVLVAFSAALKSLWVIMLANPITALVAAVAALVVVWDDGRAAMAEFLRMMLRLVDFIAGTFTGTIMGIGNVLLKIPDMVKAGFETTINFITTLLNSVVNKAIESINKVREFFGKEALPLLDTNLITVDDKAFLGIGEAFADGFRDGVLAQGRVVENTVVDFVSNIGAKVASAQVDLTKVMGGGPTPTGPDPKELAKQRKEAAKELEKAAEIELRAMEKSREAFKQLTMDYETETGKINAVYARRNQLIRENTDAGSKLQQEMLAKNAEFQEQELAQLREFEIQRIGVSVGSGNAQLETIRQQYEERLLLIQESETLTFNEKVTAQNNAYAELERLQREHFERMHADAMSFGHGQINEYEQMFSAIQQTQDMSMGNQLLTYTGVLSSITAEGAKHSKKMFELNKKAAMANVIVSTAMGAAKALEWGWPLGPIFAGLIVANGLAQLKTIRNQSFNGGAGISGATTVPGAGSNNATGGSTPATTLPETTVTNPQNQQPGVTIIVQGDIVGNDSQKIFDQLKEIIGRGDQILIESTSANGMALNSRVA